MSSPSSRYVPPERDGYECVRYMDAVLGGELVACKKIIKLCKILRPRFETGEYKCWHYDPARAKRPIEFAERFCCQPEGKPGQHIEMQPFQMFWQEVVFGWVDEQGFRQFNEAFNVRGRKNGKALALSTPIPTPRGWVPMERVHPGSYVFGADGKPALVKAESEIFDRPMYRVEFEDGEEIFASADHLWTVETKAGRRRVAYGSAESPLRTMTTFDMLDDFKRARADGKGVGYKYRVPMCEPVEYPERNLPIDPYLLGVWLGDGTRNEPRVTCGDEDIKEMMRLLSDRGHSIERVKYASSATWTIKVSHGKKGSPNPFTNALRELGICGDKRIPDMYMFSSVEQRMELLCGLMDTDGYVSKAGQCQFVQKSAGLCCQVGVLCASLGIKTTYSSKIARCSGKPAGEVHSLQFFTDKARPCFKLKRKLARLKDRLAPRMKCKSIVNIERSADEKSKCIVVDNADHLYLAGPMYTVTHNSTEQACLGLYMLTKDGEGAPQCYSAANSKPQSSLLYGSMLRMVSQSPALRRRLHKGTIPNRDEDGLIYRANGGYFTPLSSQTRNQDGLNVHFAAIDEVAAVTNRDIYDLLKQATSARDQPLIVEITTNGFERDNFFDNQYDYASRWLDGKVEDDHFLPVIYELDDRSEWSDEDMWVKANPGIDVIKKREALRGYVNKAKQDPSFLPTVMTKDFDLPENRASAWLSFEEAVNRETFDWREMGFRYCVIGYDASDTIDLTSAQALMMRPGDPKIYEMSMYWIPEMQLEKYRTSGLRKQRDNVPYDRWIEEGLVRTCPGNTIDHRVVFEWMQELRDEFDVYPFAMGYDPWHLQDDSWKDTARQFVGKNRAEQVRFGAQTLSIPMKEIKEVYAANGIVDNDNPVNQWCRMNVGVMTDTNDNIKPVKANGPTGRIDGWAAEICAYVCLKRHWEDYMASI